MKDFPNSFDQIAEVDSSSFPDMDFEEFMDWRVGGWEIPGNVQFIIRAEDANTQNIKEHVYMTRRGAQNKIKKYGKAATHNLTVAGHETIALFRAELFDTVNKINNEFSQEEIDEMPDDVYAEFLAFGDDFDPKSPS